MLPVDPLESLQKGAQMEGLQLVFPSGLGQFFKIKLEDKILASIKINF